MGWFYGACTQVDLRHKAQEAVAQLQKQVQHVTDGIVGIALGGKVPIRAVSTRGTKPLGQVYARV